MRLETLVVLGALANLGLAVAALATPWAKVDGARPRLFALDCDGCGLPTVRAFGVLGGLFAALALMAAVAARMERSATFFHVALLQLLTAFWALTAFSVWASKDFQGEISRAVGFYLQFFVGAVAFVLFVASVKCRFCASPRQASEATQTGAPAKKKSAAANASTGRHQHQQYGSENNHHDFQPAYGHHPQPTRSNNDGSKRDNPFSTAMAEV